jgi:hypothetical protein
MPGAELLKCPYVCKFRLRFFLNNHPITIHPGGIRSLPVSPISANIDDANTYIGRSPRVEVYLHNPADEELLYGKQGDRIGRIFAHWVIICFGQFFLNFRTSPHFLLLFPPKYILCINFDKNGLGYILGDFFTNSSGHPDGTAQKKMD